MEIISSQKFANIFSIEEYHDNEKHNPHENFYGDLVKCSETPHDH